jgi:hypothetical protein
MLQIYLPDWVKKRVLTQLLNLTAAAFETGAPPTAGLDSAACLAMYARFTRAQAEQRLRDGCDVEGVEQRLYRNAVEMGRRCKRWLRPSTVQEVMAIGRMLYSIIDIDLEGDAWGGVIINRCYFSRFYSFEVCRLMSAMDRGLFAGLSNGGELTFCLRITEGQPCCRAHLSERQRDAR